MNRFAWLIPLLLLVLSACSSTNQTYPARSALEQLLISAAAERAAERLALDVPKSSSVFVDNTNFEGTDSKNAIAAIRAHLLKQGMRLVDDKKNADVIIETRAGALSADHNNFLIGIPEFTLPLPLASAPLTIPQIALYGSDKEAGVAKFAIVAYDAKKGTLVAYQKPQYGFSQFTKKTLLVFIGWTVNDAIPDYAAKQAEEDQSKRPAE
jgi:hypothetical protein